MPTLFDVAKLANVSKSTVSRVVSNTGSVKKETRERILAAMEQLNYHPNYFAQAMKTNRSQSIAILVPDYGNPFFADIIKSVEQITNPKGFLTFVCETGEDGSREYRMIREVFERRIEGIIFWSYNKIAENIELLKQIDQKVPVIFMDPMMQEVANSLVTADGFQGTYNAVAYLARSGRKRIAYIKGPDKYMVTHERYQGYLQALDDFDLQKKSQFIYRGDFHIQSGFKAAEYFSNLTIPPDAVISATDYMAIGAVHYFNQNNLSIPDDIAIIGFDNISLATLIQPQLSTIALPICELGKQAACVLLERIASPTVKSRQLMLDCELIIRETT